MKVIFTRSDLIDTGWDLLDLTDHPTESNSVRASRHFERSVFEPDLSGTVECIMVLTVEGDRLAILVPDSEFLLEKAILALTTAGTNYEKIED